MSYFCSANNNESNFEHIRDDNVRNAEISSLGIDAGLESTGVTTFVQEASGAVEVFGNSFRVGTILPKDKSIQDLTDYFSRPVCISSGTLSPGNYTPIQFTMSTGNILDSYVNGETRMTGVYGFRAKLVFSLQVAATPFHQGILALGYQYGIPKLHLGVFDRGGAPQTITNLPHVRCDLSNDTMVQLKVPFLMDREYAVVRANEVWGLLTLCQIAAVQGVAGTAPPGYQILMHMEDIELFGAEPQEVVDITLQSSRTLSPVTEEFEKESHPISSGVHAISRGVRWIAKGVPSLSSIGGPTSWFMNKTAGAIRSLGYSRPVVAEPTTRCFTASALNEHNVDGALANSVIGPFASNTLRVGPEFSCTDIDEMSLAYVLRQYSQIHRFNFSTSDAVGTLKYVTPISPSCFWFRSATIDPHANIPPPISSDATNNSFQPSTLFFIGQMFKYWRGSLKFRFTFAKTKMHGGRVMVNFTPTGTSQLLNWNSKPTIKGAKFGNKGPDPFGYTSLFNLRDGNVFEFEVPYICNCPQSTFDSSIGTLTMYVADALQAPAVVAQLSTVLVEVSAGEDFEFSVVKTPAYVPHVNGTVKLQSGKMLSNTAPSVSEYTVGESITSVKQLISIPKMQVSTFTGPAPLSYIIPPWYYQTIPLSDVPGPVSNPKGSFSFGGNIATCYAFAKGGTDLHAYFKNRYANTINAAVMCMSTAADTNSNPSQSGNSNNPLVLALGGGPIHARLPAYQRTLRMLTHNFNTQEQWALNGLREPTLPVNADCAQFKLVAEHLTPNSTVVANVSTCASDDAGLAMFMGPPPLLLLKDPVVTNYDPDYVATTKTSI